MKLNFPSLLPQQIGISTAAAYQAKRHELLESRQAWQQLQAAGDARWLQLATEQRKLTYEFMARLLPQVLISQCPYCNKQIWQQVGIFSLRDDFWYYEASSGRDVSEDSLCPHLFCVDGALNLNGHEPVDAVGGSYIRQKITMAAEVPFIKPRVLNLPTMIAVIHAIPVAEYYTAYPIVYFAKQQPPQAEFCIPWAREELVARDEVVGEGTFSGQRADAQVYDLTEWLARGKVRWLDPETEAAVKVGQIQDFPYKNVIGRQHPYRLEHGQIYDLPDPIAGEAVTHWER